MRKPKPPLSLWVAAERKRHDMKPGELAERLTALGVPTAEGTVRVWESGRAPRPETVDLLERVFGSLSPREIDSETERAHAISALTAAVTAQTLVLRELTEVLRADRSHMIPPEAIPLFLEQLRAEGWLSIPETVPSTHARPQPASGRASREPVRDLVSSVPHRRSGS